MYYVIQVVSGMEDKVKEQIEVMVEKELYDDCFYPIRHVQLYGLYLKERDSNYGQ